MILDFVLKPFSSTRRRTSGKQGQGSRFGSKYLVCSLILLLLFFFQLVKKYDSKFISLAFNFAIKFPKKLVFFFSFFFSAENHLGAERVESHLQVTWRPHAGGLE